MRRPVRRPATLAVLVLVLAAVAACSDGGGPTPAGGSASTRPGTDGAATARAIRLQVYAAASLARVLDAVAAAYEPAHPGVTLAVSTDSSAALRAKIEQGAPADVFLSADLDQPQALADGGEALGDVVPFAGNRLVVIVPADNPAAIDHVADLGRPGVTLIAAADAVPVQRYTARLLDRLVATGRVPAGFPAAVAANVASREDNVGAIVTKVALGEGDAGIVYATDAMGSEGVATVELPPDADVVATYGGVVVRGASDPDAASAFLAWLAGPAGRAVLATFGFLPPNAAAAPA